MALINDHFSGNLARILERRGLSQRELAKAVGVGESVVHQWLNKKSIPRAKQWDRLSEELQVSFEELVRDPAKPPPDEVAEYLAILLKAKGYEVTRKKS